MNRPAVLFLCTGNTARSQMAEAFLRRHGGDRFEAASAGFEPSEINPMTRQVMEEVGYDLAGQRSKSLDEYLGRKHFGYLVTVCGEAEKRCPKAFPGVGRRVHWPFDDPAAHEGAEEERLEKFRQVRDRIEARVKAWIEEVGS
ncbi:MAG: arsenate reductase ArsC [Candidatus Eisenbacteria bacterium]|nr:arsenate reductase ArsC [Candidatus Eisenbacteria bacterium]